MTLANGSSAPDFTLPTDGSGTISLKGLKGQPVILYFYPKDDTSGCTAQACGFRDLFPKFKGAAMIGVSKDSVKSHNNFKAKYDLPFTLASDADLHVMQAYGVWIEKSMYGRKYMGADRATFLIDAAGKIAHIWRKVKVPGHVEEVLAAIKAL